MIIDFVVPGMMGGRASDALEPIVFAVLKALTPNDVVCRLADERLGPVDHGRRSSNLVAITVDTYSARRAYAIADGYRDRGIPVVLGGIQPTMVPDEARKHADAIVLGDAEGVWTQLVEDARTGRLQAVYESRYPSLDDLMPDRSVFDGLSYPSVALVQYGRGCRHGCDFCSVHAFYGNRLRHRSLDAVVRELRSVSTRYVMFTDDNLYAGRAKMETFLDAIEPLSITWLAQVSIDLAEHDDLLARARRAGCLALIIGLESLDDGNLAQMNKKVNLDHRDYDALIAKIHAHGIMIYGTFVFGYDGDGAESMDAALRFAQRNRLFLANFNPLTPMPGTALHRRLTEEGRFRFRPDWWLDPGFRYGDCQFEPKGMDADQLESGCAEARMRFYSLSSIGKRMFNVKANTRNLTHLGAYLGANAVSAREVRRKQGRVLGHEAEGRR